MHAKSILISSLDSRNSELWAYINEHCTSRIPDGLQFQILAPGGCSPSSILLKDVSVDVQLSTMHVLRPLCSDCCVASISNQWDLLPISKRVWNTNKYEGMMCQHLSCVNAMAVELEVAVR